jgi:hypothetical protein
MRKVAIASMAALLAGCASTPPVSELRNGVRDATFIQLGTEPLTFKLGVVDTGSFWANYGSGVSGNLGGSLLAEGAASAGRANAAQKAPEAERVLRSLYNRHPLVNEVGRSVMPQLAQLWGVPYSPAQLRVMQPGTRIEDAQGNLVGIPATTDLVLLYGMPGLTLTEKFTVGGAFAAGFTMGTNTKNVAADTFVTMHAYKRDPASGGYKKVWTGICTGMAMHSKVDYPFPEVMQSRDKAKQIFDAAVPATIESCSRAIQAQAKS